MKVLFAHDNKFCRGEDGLYYSDGYFPYRLWQRYLEVFDQVVVAGRVRPLRPGEQIENLDLSSGPGVSFVEIPSINGPVAKFIARRQAGEEIREALGKCDALIVRVVSEISRLAVEIATQMNKPWAVEVAGCTFDSLWNYGNWQGKVYAPYAAYMTKRMIKKAPYALYVTQDFLQRRYPCNGVTLACSDVQLVNSSPQLFPRRLARIEQGSRPVKIGLIGSLVHAQKGVDTAIEALGVIKERLPAFQFCILGGGNPERWQRLAEKNGVASQTVFCGLLPSGDAVSAWLDDIDIYIQPSFLEGLPRALVEAMSRGCPALGSSVGGIPELLDSGCLHPPGDSRRLASLLEQAVNDKCWQRQQAERNFHEAMQYEKANLDQRRRAFWLDFISYCKQDRR